MSRAHRPQTPASEHNRPSGSSLNPVGLAANGQHATISVLVLRGLLQAVERAGISREDFLAAAQIDAQALDVLEGRLPRRDVFHLCALALELSGNPAFALHWAENLTDRMFVPLSHLLAHCANLRHAFQMLAQFYGLLSDHADYQIVEEADKVVLLCKPVEAQDERVQRFAAELMAGGFWRLVRSFNGRARPLRVSFTHARPPYHREYARLFQGMHCFDQPFTGITFDRSLLDAPALESDEDVREALQSLVERRLHKITNGASIAQRVHEFLMREGWPHRTDMASVARALKTSVRTLRRRLADEGKSYNDALSEALATIAQTFLRGQRQTIQEVAYEMGFSDAATFHRAFKRWTGMTPSAYRGLHQKQPRD